MYIDLLTDNEKIIPTIARWYFEQWGNTEYIFSLEKEIEKLSKYLNHSKVPLILTVIKNNEFLGVAQIKEYEMEIYPEFKYWLGVFLSQKNIERKVLQKL